MSRDDADPQISSSARFASLASLTSLAVRAQHGDREAFAELYRLRAGRVFAYLAKILRERTAAEDATAETFLQAWKGIGKLRDPDRFDAWLFRIAHHVAMDELKRPHTSELTAAPEAADATVGANPEAVATQGEAAVRLRQALLALPERYREVLVLRYFGDWTDGEVARQMGTSTGNVRALRMRAMRRLRMLVPVEDEGR